MDTLGLSSAQSFSFSNIVQFTPSQHFLGAIPSHDRTERGGRRRRSLNGHIG